jgi:tetratricopeptide (TPR) repeat protein
MKTIDYSYFIESYIAGEMSPSEEAWFKKELEGNESLQREVQLRKRTDLIMKQNDVLSLRKKLVSMEKRRQERPVMAEKIKTPRFRYAAILTGLVVIGSLYLMAFRKESSEKIFRDNYRVFMYSETTRSGSHETILDAAIDYYNKGDFSKAIEGFKSYFADHPVTPKLEFLNGAANMGIENYPEAKTSFKKVIDNNNNLFIEEANWDLALCYIKTKDISTAKEHLRKIAKSESKKYSKSAKNILRHL